MGTRHAARLWAFGGVLGAAVLFAITWFFLISPKNSETASLRDQADVTSLRLPSLQKRLALLRQQNGDLDTYTDQLDRDRRALPTAAGLADFLSELQAAGTMTGVAVGGVSVGEPAQVTAGGARINALPVSLSAVGPTGNLNRFLDQLQLTQPRAVLVKAANLTADPTQPGATTLNLSLQIFVAPPSGSAAKTSITTN